MLPIIPPSHQQGPADSVDTALVFVGLVEHRGLGW